MDCLPARSQIPLRRRQAAVAALLRNDVSFSVTARRLYWREAMKSRAPVRPRSIAASDAYMTKQSMVQVALDCRSRYAPSQ